jgi:hypothetical protein
MHNPFKHIRNWIKGELRRIGALLESISRKEGVDAMKNRSISKVKDEKEIASKLGTGKFTMAGLFKSQSGKASEQ